MRLLFFTLFLGLIFSACGKKVFIDLHRTDFQYIAILDEKETDTLPFFNQTYIFRLDSLDRFVGSEYVRMRDTTWKKSMVQYAYFVFQEDGRVYYNSYAEVRDSATNVLYCDSNYRHFDSEPPKKIYFRDTMSEYARQGYYKVLKGHVAEKTRMFRAGNKALIEIEMERKHNAKMSFKRRVSKESAENEKGETDGNEHQSKKHKDKHYIVRALLAVNNDASKLGDTLKILQYEVPRNIHPLSAESTASYERNQVFDADNVFSFHLKFVKSEVTPEIDYKEDGWPDDFKMKKIKQKDKK